MASDSKRLLALLGALSFPGAASAESLLGPGVGTADSLVSEGSRLFNHKQYPKAVDTFLKATRANPANLPTYLQLARASMLAKQVQRGCYAYRVSLKAAPDSPERKKAATESDQCERQLKGLKNAPPELTQKYVETRAAFFAALDHDELLGTTGAAEALRTLVKDGFLGPELADMAQKLSTAAVKQSDGLYLRAVALEAVPADALRTARPLYEVVAEVAELPPESRGREAFLDGLAALAEKSWAHAEAHFAEAARSDPSNKEYVFHRALAMVQAGEKAQALKVLEADLPDDPRTLTLRAHLAVGHSPEAGATELEKLLFTSRYPAEK
jgi:tetratricopeptide (TPR) repeat protein